MHGSTPFAMQHAAFSQQRARGQKALAFVLHLFRFISVRFVLTGVPARMKNYAGRPKLETHKCYALNYAL